ncbi:outer membrane beta-barrel family protein [Aquimarina sediminis]|uniref:outer membrane beta-barrel family protein n=1 Tax=Aquimarina sediminis TaxID=2070536 RepID=UPI000CA05DAB|nr:outer membrane beta-barrel family protein [Aquimarina sediminis]
MMHFRDVFILFFVLNSGLVYSQNTDIKGVVVDYITKEKIPFATIALYDNDQLVDGTSTDESGNFELTTSKTFTNIRASFIGYDSYTVQLSDVSNVEDLVISLKVLQNELEEVVVEGERTTTELKIDRKVINLGADLQQAGATLLEAFDQITEVQTDLGTGSVSLRGSNNVRLLINGKPSALSTTETLEQISAAMVDKIEIITSPSAKNQANGLSGIINIVLKKNKALGLNVDLNSSVGTKRYGYGFNGNYNFSFLNFRVNASQGGREMDSEQTIHQVFNDNRRQSIYTPHVFNGMVRQIASGFDFFIDDNNEFSFEFNYTDDYHSFHNNSLYFNLTDRPDFNYLRRSSHDHKTLVFNSNYRTNFKKEGHFLELEYNSNTNTNDYPAIDFENNIFLFDENLQNDNTINFLALDYTLPLSDKINLEAGVLWNGKKVESSRSIHTDSTNTNGNFEYEESLLGAYALTSFSIHKLDWKVGLRYENFESDSFNTTTLETTDLKFSNFFPSLHVSYKLNDNNTFNFGYSKRVSRPNIHHINPFQLGNPYFRWNANPNLKSELSDNFEVNYQFDKNMLNISSSVFYRHRKEIIERLTTIDTEGVQTISFDNIGTNQSYGIEMDVRYRIAPFWTMQGAANYYFSKINTTQLITWDELYQSNIIFKNTFKINKKISADISYRHTPKRQSTFSFVDSRNRVDFAARAKFLNNRLTGSLRIIDVFDRNLFHRTTITREVERKTIWRFQSQTFGVLLSLNYKLFKNTKASRNRNRKDRDYGDQGVH